MEVKSLARTYRYLVSIISARTISYPASLILTSLSARGSCIKLRRAITTTAAVVAAAAAVVVVAFVAATIASPYIILQRRRLA